MALPKKYFSLWSVAVIAALGIALVCFTYAGSDAAEPKPGTIRLILSSAVSMRRGMWRWKKAFTPSAVWRRPSKRAPALPTRCGRLRRAVRILGSPTLRP